MLGSTPGDQTITFRLRGGSDDLPEQVPDWIEQPVSYRIQVGLL